ncbi:MAG TPA: hypothetical protein VEI50_08805 [Nitrospiraceae bacterium]|nr:hypothetical protein [Nitrospiraceae bacterium]
MQNHAEEWRTRLLGCEIDPEAFLTMAKLMTQTVEIAGRGLAQAGREKLATQAPSVDWEHIYNTTPNVLTQLMQCLDPAFGSNPPRDEHELRPWVRTTMGQITQLLKKTDRFTDPKTGLYTEAGLQQKDVKAVVAMAEAKLTGMLVEFQAALDSIVAQLIWGTPMSAVLTQALAGEETALFDVLSLNPHLIYHPTITNQIQDLIAHQGSGVVRGLATALERRPQLRGNATIGFILLVL